MFVLRVVHLHLHKNHNKVYKGFFDLVTFVCSFVLMLHLEFVLNVLVDFRGNHGDQLTSVTRIATQATSFKFTQKNVRTRRMNFVPRLMMKRQSSWWYWNPCCCQWDSFTRLVQTRHTSYMTQSHVTWTPTIDSQNMKFLLLELESVDFLDLTASRQTCWHSDILRSYWVEITWHDVTHSLTLISVHSSFDLVRWIRNIVQLHVISATCLKHAWGCTYTF